MSINADGGEVLPRIYSKTAQQLGSVSVVAAAVHGSEPKANSLIVDVTLAQLRELNGQLSEFNQNKSGVNDWVKVATGICRALEVSLECVKGMELLRLEPSRSMIKHSQTDSRAQIAMLSPKQFEYIRLVAIGYSNKQIAETKGIKVASVNQTLAKAYEKLRVRSRMQAVAVCQQHGLI